MPMDMTGVKRPEEDWEKVLFMLAVKDGMTTNDVKTAMLLFGWEEERALMAFARLEEFGLASKENPSCT